MKQFSPGITLHGPGEWFMMWVKKPFKTLRSDYLEFNQSVKQANNIGKDKLHINRPIDSQKSKDEWCYNGNGKKQRKFSLSTHYSGSSCFENVRCSSVSCAVTQWKSILDWAHGSQMTLSSHARRVYSVLPYYINYHSFHPTETSQWADSG